MPATLDSLSATPPVDYFDVGLVGNVYLRDDLLDKFCFLRPHDLLQIPNPSAPGDHWVQQQPASAWQWVTLRDELKFVIG